MTQDRYFEEAAQMTEEQIAFLDESRRANARVNKANWDFVSAECVRLSKEKSKLREALVALITASDGHAASYVQRNRARELIEELETV